LHTTHPAGDGRVRFFVPSQIMPRIEPPPFDSAAIAALVDHFYEKVRLDDAIGPVFNATVHDWDAHKRLLISFWCSIALRAGTYRGNPMAAHRPLPIHAEQFDRWLALWQETCNEHLDVDDAAQMLDYARRIGDSLKRGLGLHPQGRTFGIPIVGTSAR
jgi:hemoglobin